ncbi:hypothetical protein PQX77_018212, partial [Marasmius sp. AFHP31]
MASGQEIAKQALEAYISVGQVIVYPISTLLVMFLVYGMYIIIFGLSLNVLWHRHESSASIWYMKWTIALFVLTTIYNATMVWIQMDQTLHEFNAIKTNEYITYLKDLSGNKPSEWTARGALSGFSSVVISCIFDYLMVHRCYVIWGYSRWILYPFALVVLATNVTGFVDVAIVTAAYQHRNHVLYMRSHNINNVLAIISVVYASLLTLLTAGRIWWIVRQAGQITGSRVYTKYKIFVVTILESGLLYSIIVVVSLALPLIMDFDGTGIIPFDFSAIANQMA